MTDDEALEADAQALLGRLHAAQDGGASRDQLVAMVLEAGWRPVETAREQEHVLDGVLASGRHVPIRIRRAPPEPVA